MVYNPSGLKIDIYVLFLGFQQALYCPGFEPNEGVILVGVAVV